MSRFRTFPLWARWSVCVCATAAVYVVTARLGLALAIPPERKATAVWPPSGIALAVLLLAGYRIWPGVWLGAFLANLWDLFAPSNAIPIGTHLIVSSTIATGSTVQALVGAYVLHRWVGRDAFLERLQTILRVVGLAPLICLVAATVGVTALVLTGLTHWPKYWFSWWTWWLGDTVGILIGTPLMLVWSRAPRFDGNGGRRFEAALLCGLLVGVGWFVFGGWSPWGIVAGALTYLTVPLLVWAACRFGQHGATVGLLLISGIAVWGTAHGHGPFVQNTLNESLLLLQTFVGVLVLTILALASALAERRRADQARVALIGELETALTEIKTIRGLIPICAWCKNIRNDEGCWEQLEAYLRDHTQAEFSHSICPACVQKRFNKENMADR